MSLSQWWGLQISLLIHTGEWCLWLAVKSIPPSRYLSIHWILFKTRDLCFDSEFCLLGGTVSFPSSWFQESHALRRMIGLNKYWGTHRPCLYIWFWHLALGLSKIIAWATTVLHLQVIALASWVKHTLYIHPAFSTGLARSTHSFQSENRLL